AASPEARAGTAPSLAPPPGTQRPPSACRPTARGCSMTLLDEPEPAGRRSAVGDALIVAGDAEPALATRTGERGVYVALGVTVIAVGVMAAATSISALATATDL